MNPKDLRPKDLGKACEQLIQIEDLMPLSFPYDQPGMEPEFPEVKPEWRERYCTSLDGCVALDTLQRPQTEAEEIELVQKFLNGLEKVFPMPIMVCYSPYTYLLSTVLNVILVRMPAIFTRLPVIRNCTGLSSELMHSERYIKTIAPGAVN